ncbi:MAG: ABC transporter substrate-binding protein [Solirubrobacteraceae bacterium]
MRVRSRWAPIAVASLAALVVAGCGSSSSSSKKSASSTPAATTTTPAAGTPVTGGSVTVLEVAGGIDNLDPGYWYYQTDYEDILRTTQRTLYSFTSQGTTPVPDLATASPVLSNGNKTLTIHIKPGIKYSPPLQTQTVTSSDIKYAMERCFLASVANGYAAVYYSKIVGAPSKPATTLPNITGLQTPNPTTLVINTSVPVGVLTDSNALSLPCTVPVPESYAAKYDKGATSTYSQHELFTGPYMINGAASGTIGASGYQAGKLLDLVRNPSFDKTTDPLVHAYLDSIVFKGGNDITVSSQQVLKGTSLVSGDYAAPPVSILQQGLSGPEKPQFNLLPSDGNRYISLDTKIPPLNNVNFRRAIAAIVNRNALRLTRGGPALGTIATHFIPPGMPGFAEAGGVAGPGYDFMSNPSGSLTVAEKYMKLAGYSSGKYTGPPLLTIADSSPPASNTALAFQSQVAALGIKLTFREVPHSTLLSKFCLVPKASVAMCPTLGWGKDFYDSQSMIDPVFNGKNIVPAGNTNTAQANDPTLNAAMNAAEQLTDPTARAAAWGALDKQVTAQAFVIPWLWDNDVAFASKNVHGITWAFNGNTWDLANTWVGK